MGRRQPGLRRNGRRGFGAWPDLLLKLPKVLHPSRIQERRDRAGILVHAELAEALTDRQVRERNLLADRVLLEVDRVREAEVIEYLPAVV